MRRICFLLLLPLAAWAQLDDNTLTVSASRQLPAVQPDQAVFTVQVAAPFDAALTDVLGALAGTGISAANLTGVQSEGTQNYWTFSLTVPFAQLGSTAASLQKDAGASAMLQISYFLSSQASAQAQSSQQCPYALLVQDAQAQAQRLATAAGVPLGPILAVSDGSTLAMPTNQILLQGNFSAVVSPYFAVQQILSAPIQAPPSCTMTVQFSLTH